MNKPLFQTKFPLYHVVKERLRHQIEENYHPGDCIPPETALTKEFGVSQITVRRAIHDLVREGVLYRRQGKGTFVSMPKFSQDLTILHSFTKIAIDQHRTMRTKTISTKILDSKTDQRFFSDLVPPILEVVRLRIVDDQPLALNSSYYALNSFPGLSEIIHKDPNCSIYNVLKEQYGIEPSVQEQSLELVFTDDWEANLLDVEPMVPVFLFNIKTQNQYHVLIEYVRTIYRSDRCKFTMFPKRAE